MLHEKCSSPDSLLLSVGDLTKLLRQMELSLIRRTRGEGRDPEDQVAQGTKNIRCLKLALGDVKDKLDSFGKDIDEFDTDRKKLQNFYISLRSEHKNTFEQCTDRKETIAAESGSTSSPVSKRTRLNFQNNQNDASFRAVRSHNTDKLEGQRHLSRRRLPEWISQRYRQTLSWKDVEDGGDIWRYMTVPGEEGPDDWRTFSQSKTNWLFSDCSCKKTIMDSIMLAWTDDDYWGTQRSLS